MHFRPMRLYEVIGQRVRARREELELTQAALAAAAGLTRSSISNLEIGGQRVPLEQLVHIAYALGCDYRDLLPALADFADAPARPVTPATLREDAPATAEFLDQLGAPPLGVSKSGGALAARSRAAPGDSDA